MRPSTASAFSITIMREDTFFLTDASFRSWSHRRSLMESGDAIVPWLLRYIVDFAPAALGSKEAGT
jgi:hypothetical protein